MLFQPCPALWTWVLGLKLSAMKWTWSPFLLSRHKHIVSLKDDFMAAVCRWGHCWLRPPKEMKYKGRKILSYTIFWAFFALVVVYSVVSDSLWPQGLQHARLPCPSSSPGANWNSCPVSWWCHPTISSSVVPFSSCPQSFPASGSFLIS